MAWDVYGDQLQWEMKDLDLASDFETAWKAATETQKLWFLIRFEEIKKISKRADFLKGALKEIHFNEEEVRKRDVFAYRFWILTLFIIFVSTLIFIKDIRYLILALSICYIGFKSIPVFFQDIFYDFYYKKRIDKDIEYRAELRDIEIFLTNETPLNQVYNYIVFGESKLENYVKNSLIFQKHLLEDSKEAFKFKTVRET